MLRRIGIETRKREELLHEAGGSVDALVEAHEALLARLVGLGALCELNLKLEGRQRRAEFVGGVGGEALLC